MHEVGDGCGDADGEDVGRFVAGEGEFAGVTGVVGFAGLAGFAGTGHVGRTGAGDHEMRIEREVAAACDEEPYVVGVGADVGDDGGARGAGRAPAEHVDEQRVETDVDEGSRNGADRGGAGESFGAQEVGRSRLTR